MTELHHIESTIEHSTGKILSRRRIASDSNEIWLIECAHGKFIAKIYDVRPSQRAGPTREIELSKRLNGLAKTRELLLSDNSETLIPHRFAVYKYIEGQTLFALLSNEELSDGRLDVVSNNIAQMIEAVTAIEAELYGRLDATVTRGTVSSWAAFLLNDMAGKIEETFRRNPIVSADTYSLPRQMLISRPEEFDFSGPKLVPVDLNTKNILVAENGDVTLLDLKSFVSGDPLYAYAQFYACMKGTPLGERFLRNLALATNEEFRFAFYGLLSNLNVLGYIARLEAGDACLACPWSNKARFVDLIAERATHLKGRR
ncbi:hypothetical protein JQ629_32345 [Bradyrhizobium sp. AUGA SZCCT0222]|uniref:phosphotransferase n=1 Tax=Bradyrhizobium sp. AUGA SZCCT0222 TaxID=2807668 RepID=UPI001BA5461E|nr:phosphotransferase [Bradyrhizobium sp. AUGA SZCCT0222]MBR1272176.1 hypothetical protein [Bradyrhizobium sp. AUGA SZCCT0222]